MDMIAVKSKQLHSVGYDPATKTMRIRFADRKDGTPGPMYDYSNVGPDDHSALMAADSKGKHFGAHIKPHAHKFPFSKVVEKKEATC